MTFDNFFRHEQKVIEVSKLSKDILGQDFISLEVSKISFKENFPTNKVIFEGTVMEKTTVQEVDKNIQGEGVGFVDSCFDAFIHEYESLYPTLRNIAISDFFVKSDLTVRSRRKSDAELTAFLTIKNSEGEEFSFSSTSSSLTYSGINVTAACISFFINAEAAFKRAYFAKEDAQKRGRIDLVDFYQSQMSTLVHVTSYETVVKNFLKK